MTIFLPTQGVIEEEEVGERRNSRKKSSLVPDHGLRKFSLGGGMGLEGKTRRVRTLTRIRESLRSSFQASIRSNGGRRSDVLPRKKSIASLSSESTATSPVLDRTVQLTDLVVEKGGVVEGPQKSNQQIVEAVIEKSTVEEQHIVKWKQRAVAEQDTKGIMVKQESVEQNAQVFTEQEPDLEQSAIEKQMSVKQKQCVVYDESNMGSIEREHVAEQCVVEKQHSIKEKQHSIKEKQGSVEVELELVPVKGHYPVLV